MVVHADGEGVAVKALSESSSGAIGLEGKVACHPPLNRMTEDAEPLYDSLKQDLDATTNLIDAPENGKR